MTTTAETPITFRLPPPGVSDPHFGFSRSFYYMLEKRGALKLIRIVEPGRTRGITLIRYADVAALIREKMEEQGKENG
jgi:hypothetical protein